MGSILSAQSILPAPRLEAIIVANREMAEDFEKQMREFEELASHKREGPEKSMRSRVH